MKNDKKKIDEIFSDDTSELVRVFTEAESVYVFALKGSPYTCYKVINGKPVRIGKRRKKREDAIRDAQEHIK